MINEKINRYINQVTWRYMKSYLTIVIFSYSFGASRQEKVNGT